MPPILEDDHKIEEITFNEILYLTTLKHLVLKRIERMNNNTRNAEIQKIHTLVNLEILDINFNVRTNLIENLNKLRYVIFGNILTTPENTIFPDSVKYVYFCDSDNIILRNGIKLLSFDEMYVLRESCGYI
jgi:hypothetical protein